MAPETISRKQRRELVEQAARTNLSLSRSYAIKAAKNIDELDLDRARMLSHEAIASIDEVTEEFGEATRG